MSDSFPIDVYAKLLHIHTNLSAFYNREVQYIELILIHNVNCNNMGNNSFKIAKNSL